jgi:hypothetical protein
VRALYFVRRRPSLGAKLGIRVEFPPNCFPITPPRNGNIGNGHKDLLESGFKIDENSPMPKKIAAKIFTKNKNNFFGTCLFSTFKAKNVVFCLKVPKREIFDRSDFPDFYTIKPLRVGDFGVKI